MSQTLTNFIKNAKKVYKRQTYLDWQKKMELMIKENSKAVIGFAKNFLERVTEVYNQIEIDDEW